MLCTTRGTPQPPVRNTSYLCRRDDWKRAVRGDTHVNNRRSRGFVMFAFISALLRSINNILIMPIDLPERAQARYREGMKLACK